MNGWNKKEQKYISFCLSVLAFLTVWIFGVHAAVSKKMPEYFVSGDWKNNPNAGDGRKLATLISKPVEMSWTEAQSFYDSSRSLPEPTKAELKYEVGFLVKTKVQTQHLPKVFEAIYNRQFTDPKYGLKTPVDPKEDWLRSFGNLAAHFRPLRGNAERTDFFLKRIENGYPVIWAEVKHVLPHLVRNNFLYGSKWTPWSDESASGKNDDGILFMPYWKIKKNAKRAKLWNTHLGEHKVYQGGVIIYASLQSIKQTERDYKQYFDHIGMGFLEVAPLAGSYRKGRDPRGNEFIALETFFRQDLPFPYDSTRFSILYLDYYTPKGFYISDYHSLNRADVNWMAGRDTFFPLKTSKGDFVGWLIATELDFDIKGLPERDKDRVVSIKGAWGNIKLIAEGFAGRSKMGTGPGEL